MGKTASPPTVEWMGTQYKILLDSEKSGSLGLFETLNQPGYGPPRHIHRREDETFYVLSGEVEFWMAGISTFHGPGEVVFIPRGTDHTFRVVGALPVRMLTAMTPGGFEGFFVEMARGQFMVPRDMPQIAGIGEKYHLTFTGPPLGGA